MPEQPLLRPPAAVLDDRYGRGEPIAGFLGRAAIAGGVAGLAGTVAYGALLASAWGADVWAVLLYGVLLVVFAGAEVGVVSALAGAAAERLGRSRRARTALLGVVGGAVAAGQVLLAVLLVGGAVAATYPPVAVVALASGALGGAVLVRLRRRTLRAALRLRAPAR